MDRQQIDKARMMHLQYLSRLIVRVCPVDEDGRLGHGHGCLLVPVGGDGASHLQVRAEMGAVAIVSLDHLLDLAVVGGLSVHVDASLQIPRACVVSRAPGDHDQVDRLAEQRKALLRTDSVANMNM